MSVTSSKYIHFGGWVSAGISLLFLPFVFGLIGIVFGFLYSKTNKKQGKLIMIIAAVAMLFGVIFSLMANDTSNTVYYWWY